MRKLLLIGAGVLVLLIAVAVYFVVNIDSVAKSKIERIGTRISGVPVTVESVDISLAAQSVTLNGLAVANPPGFSQQPAIRFDEISATIGAGGDVVKQVRAVAPAIRVEGAPGRTNIDVLRGNVAASSAAPRSGEGTPGAGAGTGDSDESGASGGGNRGGGEDDAEPSATFVIERVDIERPSAVVDLEGMDAPVTLEIERIEFRDLQGTRSDVTRQLLDQLTASILDAVHDRLGELAGEAIRAEIERRSGELKEKAGNALKKLLE